MVRCGTWRTKTSAGNWTRRARVRRTRCTRTGAASAATPKKNNGVRNDIKLRRFLFSQRIEQVRKRGLPPPLPGFEERGQAPLPDLFYSKPQKSSYYFPARRDRN